MVVNIIDTKQYFELIIYEIRFNFDTPLALKWLKTAQNGIQFTPLLQRLLTFCHVCQSNRHKKYF